GDDSRRAVSPLEAEGDVEQYADEREERDGDRLVAQRRARHSAHSVGADNLEGVALSRERVVHADLRAEGAERLGDLRAAHVDLRLPGDGLARLHLRQAYEHLAGLVRERLDDRV